MPKLTQYNYTCPTCHTAAGTIIVQTNMGGPVRGEAYCLGCHGEWLAEKNPVDKDQEQE